MVIGKSRSIEVRQLRPPAREGVADADTSGAHPIVAGGSGGSNTSPFPVVLSAPINGRITTLSAVPLDSHPTSLLFLTTDQHQYALIGYNPHLSPHFIQTFASGSLKDEWNVLGTLSECGPFVAVDPHSRCLILHLYDGLVTIFPILNRPGGAAGRNSTNSNNTILGQVFHARLEERIILAMTVLHHIDPSSTPPHLCLLHQDSRGAQHIVTHVVDLRRSQLLNMATSSGQAQQQQQAQQQSAGQQQQQQLHQQHQLHHHIPPAACEWLKKSRIDGGSSLLIPVPPRRAAAAAASANPNATTTTGSRMGGSPSGGVVVLGQRQITFCALNHYKVMPIPPALILSWSPLPPDVSGMPRFLLGDEFGNLHMLTLITQENVSASVNTVKVMALQLDTLGSCTLSSSLQYLDHGLVFCGSTLGDSQLVQIHDEPIPVEDDDIDEGDAALELGDTTYLSVVEEYTHLGPIVDFDLMPMAGSSSPAALPDETTGVASSVPSSFVLDNGSSGNVGVQSQVVTASGSSKSGSLRIIRNGIGMKEYANVELSGIQNMWNIRRSFDDVQDSYLVQSFVGETRVLGVASSNDQNEDGNIAMVDDMEDAKLSASDQDDTKMRDDDDEGEDVAEAGGTLEEVFLPGLESNASTLHVNNVVGNLFLQITDSQVRLASSGGDVLDTITPETNVTVATANEAGQIMIALRGGTVLHLEVENEKLVQRSSRQMDREVSCLNINPFLTKDTLASTSMDIVDGNEKETAGKPNRVAHRAKLCAVGLWDDFTVRLLSLEGSDLIEALQIHLSTEEEEEEGGDGGVQGQRRNRNNMMARSLCLITLDFSSSNGSGSSTPATVPGTNMLFVGLGDGTLISFAVIDDDGIRVQSKKEVSLGTQRINLIPLHNVRGGTCVLATGDRPTVIYLAGMGGASGRTNYNPKLCYSNVNLSPADEGETSDVSRPHSHESIAVNVAAPFFSPLLFDDMGNDHYSLCVADDANLRLGVIDDIQKLHVTTCRLGMAPRRVVHCPEGRMFAVGCIESGIKGLGVDSGELAMGNCIRFLDDSSFEDIHRIDLEPSEMVLSMISASLRTYLPSSKSEAASSGSLEAEDEDGSQSKSYLVIGTGYALHDEDEPTNGRILVYSCNPEDNPVGGDTSRTVQQVTELSVRGGVYSMCQFYDGRMLVTVNSKTQLCQLGNDGTGVMRLNMVGVGHHGHILSLFVSSRAPEGLINPTKLPASAASVGVGAHTSTDRKQESNQKEMLAIVGDLMRSISLVQYFPQYETLEEVARDFNANWTTAVTMLTDDVYLGGENWNNLFVLRRNTKAKNEEVRCRLDTVGEFHLGEMCNKFMSGSLVMPSSGSGSSSAPKGGASQNRRPRPPIASPKKLSTLEQSGKVAATSGGPVAAMRSRRPVVTVGSQTLFGTVDGTLGVILGLDGPTAAFFTCLERSLDRVVPPIGNFSHQQFRSFNAEQRIHPCHGFVDGDLIESFLDLDKGTMEKVVQQMNKDGSWDTTTVTFISTDLKTTGEEGTTDMDESQRPELSVDDVLALVEEMTMLH